MTFSDLFDILCSIPKTLRFNFHYFPFATAVKLPVIVSHRVVLRDFHKSKGEVALISEPKMAMIKIGFGDVGHYDRKRSRSIWQNNGTVEFLGKASIGHGSKISVRGNLVLGDGFNITAESTIVCANKIVFGNDCLLSWDILIMDTDEHPVYNLDGHRTNPDKPIFIGDHVWIGCKCMILKGASIPDDCIVAANTMIKSAFCGTNQIIGGNPAQILREGVVWKDQEDPLS